MKLFVVTAEVEVAVYAEDARKAEELAQRHIRDVDAYEFGYHAHEIKELKYVDADLADSPPYGTTGDKTVRMLFEELNPKKEIPDAG